VRSTPREGYAPVSLYFREKAWGEEELFEIMKEIAEAAITTYIYSSSLTSLAQPLFAFCPILGKLTLPTCKIGYAAFPSIKPAILLGMRAARQPAK